MLRDKNIGITILAGDFNETLTQNDRIYKNITTKSKQTCQKLTKIIQDFNLTDIWRVLHTYINQFTWKRKNSDEKSRIDMFLIDENLTPLVKSCDIRPAQIKFTDHLAISIKITQIEDKGPNYWKLNNSLLKEESYIQLIIQTINNCKSDYENVEVSDQLFWEICKLEIKKNNQLFTQKKIAKEKRTLLFNLENELKHLLFIEDNYSFNGRQKEEKNN